MKVTQRTVLIAIIIIVVVLIAIAFFQKYARDSSGITSDAATSTATSTQNGISGTGEFNVTPGTNTIELNIPSFHGPLKFSSSIQADVKAALQKADDTLITKLEANQFDLKAWLDLGTVRKMAGDYKGAEEAWKFVTQAAPNHPVAYNNLGDLYTNFLKDYPKAESAYLKAISLAPEIEQPYIDLYTMYANLYKKNTNAAEDILKKGVANNPDSIALHVELARYYKSKGDTEKARIQYEAAIAAARKAGQDAAAGQIQAEEKQ